MVKKYDNNKVEYEEYIMAYFIINKNVTLTIVCSLYTTYMRY
jgi:hypothetical protein